MLTSTTRAAVHLNIAPFGSPLYCDALATLAGVKLRKVRVAAMVDRGRLTDAAATRIAATLRRYHGVVPYSDPAAVLCGHHGLHVATATGSADAIADSIARGGYRAIVIDGSSAPTAHGALAAALRLPMPVVGAALLDPVALLDAAGARGVVVLVVAMTARAGGATEAWATALLRACGGRYEANDRLHGLYWIPARGWLRDTGWRVVVVTPPGHPLTVDGVVRLEL